MFSTIMFFLDVDPDSRCDYRSKVDFVHFIWDKFERFSIRKFAITIIRSDNVPAPLNLPVALPCSTRLLYFKYYMAASDSLWMDRKNCGEYIIKNRRSLKFISRCRRPGSGCSCIICKRKPPSLRDICSDIHFRNIRHFELTTFATFNQYVNAVESVLVPFWQLISPGFPLIRISFCYNSFETKFHHDCPGEGSWPGQISRTFEVFFRRVFGTST